MCRPNFSATYIGKSCLTLLCREDGHLSQLMKYRANFSATSDSKSCLALQRGEGGHLSQSMKCQAKFSATYIDKSYLVLQRREGEHLLPQFTRMKRWISSDKDPVSCGMKWVRAQSK